MGRGLVCAAVVLCALAGAESAHAGTLSKVGTEYHYTELAGTPAANNVSLFYCAPGPACSGNLADPGDYFLISDSAAMSAGSSGCAPWAPSPSFMQCPATGIAAWRIALTDGNDVLDVQPCCGNMSVPVTAFGGEGNDSLTISAGSQIDVLDGGPGVDSLSGGAGHDGLRGGADNDSLNGGPGDDFLDGGFGSDVVNGGDGAGDVLSFADRTERVTVDLGAGGSNDGSANDGAPGARDTVGADVEGVTGGSGDDLLSAADTSAALRGSSGDDTLVGGVAGDLIDGGTGADSIYPAAGLDNVLGGAGVDYVDARDDAEDTLDCGPDYDDARTDSVDTVANCDPAPPPEPPPSPAPVVERVVETQTVVLPGRLLFDLGYVFAATRRSTTLRELSLGVERGAGVTASCRTPKGKRCRSTRDIAKASAVGTVRLRGFEGRPLPVGSKLQIRAIKDGMIGVVKTLTVRRRRAPSVKTLCLAPGAARPGPC